MDNKKNDWFATLLYNPDLSLAELEQLNIVPDNSSLLKKEDYRNIPAVIDIFTDENGNFKEKEFSSSYDGALALYNKYANGEYEKKIPVLHEYLDSKWDRPLEAKVADINPTFDLKDSGLRDPNKNYLLTSTTDLDLKTPKEIAESQEVIDYLTGEKLGWTPEDKGGFIAGLVRPTIVVASWDEDGTHMENGREVSHKAGDLKFNENGLPYPETLGNRELRTKQIIGYGDTLTRETSGLNKFDFFDSDDYEKSFVGTVAKTAFKTIPYFIPGVAEVVGGITAAEALLRVIPVLGKMVNGMTTGDSDNEFGKTMNRFEGWMAKFDPTVSQKSQENLVTFENFGNLISSISGQLFQQRMVGSLPYLLNGKQATEKSAKLGKDLALAYMAATSGQEAYDTFKDAGASDRVAGFATLANMVALWRLMKIDYFRENLFKGKWYMDESQVRAPAFNVAKDIRQKLTENGAAIIAEGEQAVTKQGSLNFLNKLTKFYTDTMVAGVVKGGIPARMLSEGIEETMEEATTDLIKVSTHILDSLGVNVTEEGAELNFNTTPQEMLQRYGMSFFGGLLGGGIFAGQEKLEQSRLHRTIGNMDVDDTKKFIYYVAQGKGQEIKDLYTKWHKLGLLGSKDLSTNLTTISSVTGNTPVAESVHDNLSQNDVVYRHLINTVDFLQNLIDSEAIGFTKQQIDNIRTSGFEASDKTIRAQTLIDLGAYTTLEDDLLSLAADIVKKNNEIQQKLDEIGVPNDTSPSREDYEKKVKNNKEVQKLQDELKELRKKRESILNGELNYKYALQSLFITNPKLSSRITGDLSKEAFTRVKYNLIYNTLTEDQKSSIDEEYAEFTRTTGKDRLIRGADLYYAMSSRWGKEIAEMAKKLSGFNPDSFHKSLNLGTEQYQNTAKELEKLEKEIIDLRKKENLTSEEQIQLNNNLEKLTKLQVEIERFNKSPWRALSMSAEENSEFKDINEALIRGNFNDLSLIALGDRIKAMYQKTISDKKVLSGDFELQALYNEIRKRYAGVDAKFNEYLKLIDRQIVAESERKGEETPDLEVERWQNNINGDSYEDRWITEEYGEQSDIHDDVKKELQVFVDNFGIDNRVAIKALDNIINILKTRTKLSDEQIQEFLNVVLPKYGVDRITKFMSEMDALRNQVTYSPISELLQKFWFDYSGTQSSLIDLITSEEKKLVNSESLSEYSIDNEQLKRDFETAKNILDVVGAIILGATDKTNSTINAFEKTPTKLIELENKDALILANDIDVVRNRIHYLETLSNMNEQRALKVHERIDKNMRSRFLKTLISPIFVEKFEKVFKYRVGDIEKPINLKDILTDVLPPNFSFDSIDLIDPKVLQEIWTSFEQALYTEMSKLEYFKDDAKLADNLLSLFNEEIWQMVPSKLSDNSEEIIQPIDILTYLMSICCIPSNAFYTTYKNTTTKANFKFAPVFGQEYAVRGVTAAMSRSKLWNTVLDKIMENAKREVFSKISGEDAETRRKYLESLSKLKNFYMIPGGAGTGKTTGVAGTIAAMFASHPSKQFIAIAPKKGQAENVKKELGDDAQYMTCEQFFTAITGGKPSEYKLNTENGHIVRTAPAKYASNIFDASKALKVLVIDEVGLLTEAELKEISFWAVSNGVFVVGLGDPKQNSTIVNVKETITKKDGTKEETFRKTVSGLEDCAYFKSPMLVASLRSANLAKKLNFEVMDSALFDVWYTWSQNRDWSVRRLDGLVPATISLQYYEDSTKLYGEKLVDDNADLIAEAKKFAARLQGKEIGIIYDKSVATKYDNVKEELAKQNIRLIPYDEMQGDELEYIFVDVDFLEHSKASDKSSKYLMLKNIYTVSQRSRVGSIIKKDHINAIDGFSIVDNETSNPKLNQEVSLTERQIQSFKEYRGNAMSGIPEDNTFYTFFNAIPSKTPGAAGKPGEKKSGEDVPDPSPSPDPKPGTKRFSTQSFHVFMAGDEFTAYDQSSNSISKKIPDFGKKEQLELYKQLINSVSSRVRKNGRVELNPRLRMTLERIFGSDAMNKLNNYLSQNWQLYITPYSGNTKLIVARFGSDNDYIEVPISFVETALIGKYNGGLKRESAVRVSLNNANWMTIDEFQKAYPGVYIFNKAGVVVFDPYNNDIESDTILHNGSKNFLLGYKDSDGNRSGGNNGKTFIIVTDEVVDLDDYADVWEEPDDGNLISHYHQVQVIGIHKPLHLKDIVAFVNAIQQGKSNDKINLTKLVQDGLWEENDPNNPIEAIKALDWASLPAVGTKAYYQAIYGRKWQVVPEDRANKLSKILVSLANKNEDYAAILDDIGLFLNTLVDNSKLYETHGVELAKEDGTGIFIMPIWRNETIAGYRIYNVDNGVIDFNSSNAINFNDTRFPYQWLCDTYLSGEEASIGLRRYVRQEGENFEVVNLTPNDQLFILTESISKNQTALENLNSDLLKSQEFINFVYMDDNAKSDGGERLPGSTYFAELNGDYRNGYVLSPTGVNYSSYSIDESKISPAPVKKPEELLDPNLKLVKDSLNVISRVMQRSGMSGFSMLTDQEINDLLKSGKSARQIVEDFINEIDNNVPFNPNSPVIPKLVWEGTKVRVDFEKNLEQWIAKKMKNVDPSMITITYDYCENEPTHADDSYVLFGILEDINADKQNMYRITWNNGTPTISRFESVRTLAPLLQLYDEDTYGDSPIDDYLGTLASGSSDPEVELAAFEWMKNHPTDPIISLINEHLIDRLSRDNEC